MKSQIRMGVCFAVFSAANLWAVVGGLYDQSPVEDAYVDNIRPNNTYNTATLQIQGFGNDPFPGSGVDSVQRSFLKFDVSAV